MSKKITLEFNDKGILYVGIDVDNFTVDELTHISLTINDLIDAKIKRKPSEDIKKIPKMIVDYYPKTLNYACYRKFNELVDEMNKLKNNNQNG